MEAPETSKRCVNEVEQDRVPFQNRFDARLGNAFLIESNEHYATELFSLACCNKFQIILIPY